MSDRVLCDKVLDATDPDLVGLVKSPSTPGRGGPVQQSLKNGNALLRTKVEKQSTIDGHEVKQVVPVWFLSENIELIEAYG